MDKFQSFNGSRDDIESLTQEQASESNAIEVPSISLPKGGGAIRSIDESFKVNASNGTGSCSVPLPITPSRNGFEPAIGLVYGSGSGNGSVGLGWQFNLASISRKTDNGIPRYYEEDTFLFSESDDLVPFYEEVAAGDWQAVSFTDGDYQIKRFRPRVEGGFARIEKIVHSVHLTYWKVTTKDNLVTIYGRSEQARIADPESPERIFKWLPEFSYDHRGNWIKYEYKSEDKTNIPSFSHELNRINDNAIFNNRYIKRVRYGNRVAWYPDSALPYDPPAVVDNQHYFELVFDYGEHHPDIPLPEEDAGLSWPYRDDAFSSYRSGFEIRTNRLCQRVLMFHHFSNEAEFGENYLVRSLDFEYKPSSINQSGVAEVSYLSTVTQSGYIRKDDGAYSKKSLPPIEYGYQELDWNKTIQTVAEESLSNLPEGLSGNYQWIDLYGEGISGILTEVENGLYYKSNLGDVSTPGSVEFSHTSPVINKPSFSGFNQGVLSLRDLAASGEQQIVVESADVSGYYQLNSQGEWEPFKAFESWVNLDFTNPNLRRLDVTGDGQAELVISEEQAFVWYAADGKKGYKAAERVSKLFDEELGPTALFSDITQSIYLADMSGDGLTDIVRIRNGEVCYWPNQGYGKFGAKVTMSNAPYFDLPDQFNPKYLQLADVNGTGTTDIIYLGGSEFKAYLNHSGNGWSDPQVIDPFFKMDQNANVAVIDLMGTGTSCIVWSSGLPVNSQNPMRYIDLMSGKKPHVLNQIENNLGHVTTLNYKSSSYFYLKDKLAGKPWSTKLPFPVQVVESIVSEDKISKLRFSSHYHYRHGYYDSEEREFRGFGIVEQTDSEFYEQWKANSLGTHLELSEEFYQPPTLTRTFFHTGAFIDQERIINQYEEEYWFNQYNEAFPSAPLAVSEPTLPEAIVSAIGTILDPNLIADMSADEWREAVRVCKGLTLRQEMFSLDAPQEGATEEELKLQALPYSVSSSNCHIRVLQPRLENDSNVFLLNASENLEIQYERNPEDPRIAHNLTLKTNEYNQVLEEASVVYGRDSGAADAAFQELTNSVTDFSDFDEQTKLQNAFANNISAAKTAQTSTHVTISQNSYTNEIATSSDYRIPMGSENKSFHITGLSPADDIFIVSEFDDILLDTVSTEIDYSDPPGGGIERRLIEHFQSIYYQNDLTAVLPLGQIESLGLSYENYQLAFTPDLLTRIYGAKLVAPYPELVDAKYFDLNADGRWWIRSGLLEYIDVPGGETFVDAQQRFYSALSYTDAYGTETTVQYRAGYDGLLLETVTDALGNVTHVENFNFRTLAVTTMRDMNDNLSGVLVDELGMVKATASLGKDLDADGVAELDLADSFAGLTEESDGEEAAISTFFTLTNSNDIIPAGKALLGSAGRRFIYDLDAYQSSSSPSVVVSIQRERHAADLLDSPVQISYDYSDGGGSVAMTKVQAEPGEALEATVHPDDSYAVSTVDTSTMVPSRLRWIGKGRTVVNNKGKAVFQYEPYFSVTPAYEDIKELVEIGVSAKLYYDPIGRMIKTVMPDKSFNLAQFDSWHEKAFDRNDTVSDSQWYQDRLGHLIDAELTALGKDPTFEEVAALLAEEHYDTPNSIYLDSLGRPILSLSHNGKDSLVKDLLYSTRVDIDIEGNARSVTDARGHAVMQYDYDMLGHRVYQNSPDSGERWTLNNVVSKPHLTWDSKSQVFSFEYDVIQRPLELKVTGGEDPLNPLDNVYGKLTYGEGEPNDKELNLRGAIAARYDTAGKLTFHSYDRTKAVLSSSRQMTIDYRNLVDWQGAGLDAKLEPDLHTTTHTYDALGRAMAVTSPEVSVTEYTYTEAGLLGTVDVTQTGVAKTRYVEEIRYDVKARREFIRYRSGLTTNYYHDPETSRLIRLETRKGDGEILQDIYYTYDPMGNITHQQDKSQPIVFFNNQKTEALSTYRYDALYQLIEANGREHAGQQIDFASGDNWQDEPFLQSYDAGDVMAWRNYTQEMEYDPVGNILQHRHVASGGHWVRDYNYSTTNNQLSSTTIDGNTHNYTHHPTHGYIDSMPHLPVMEFTFKDQLQAISKQSVSSGTPEMTYYMYDSGGQRVRKVTDNAAQAGQTPTKKSERLYLSGAELYFEYSGAHDGLERKTLHVMDDARRIAMIDTRNGIDDGTPERTVRFQFSNHLDSSNIETDDTGEVISYEEFHPFGTTSYQAKNSAIPVSIKRYRYTGKERDEESGLMYFGARYYICWLGRWLSADPSGMKGGVNVYRYIQNKPISFRDPTGLWEMPSWETVAVVTAVVVVGVAVTVATAGAAGPIVAGAVASAGLSGTAATVATGAAVGVISGAVGGAAAGAAGETTRQVAHGEDLDGGRILSEAGTGAAYGAAIGGAVGAAIPAVAAGATAAAGTSTGAAVVAGARSVGQSVASSAVGRGTVAVAQSVARSSGGQAAGAVLRGTGRAVQAVNNAGLRAGGEVAARTFAQGSAGAQAASAYVASGGSAAATFRQAASTADDAASATVSHASHASHASHVSHAGDDTLAAITTFDDVVATADDAIAAVPEPVPLQHQPTSGATLTTTPGRTTTVIGNYPADMQYILAELDVPAFSGTIDDLIAGFPQGNPGGLNFLNVTEDVVRQGAGRGGFFNAANTRWVDAAVQRGDDIIVASHPRYMTRPGQDALNGFGKEVQRFLQVHGYEWADDLTRLLPPGN